MLSAAVYAVEPMTAEVKTTQATIFLNGAELQQQATLRLQKGQNEVRLEGLSPNADKQSVSVSLNGGAVVAASEYSIDYLTRPKMAERVTALQDSVKKTEQQLAAVENDIQVNKQMRELLQSGVTHTMEASEQTLSTETMEKNLKYYQQRGQQLFSEATTLNQRKTKINERLTALKNQLKQENSQNRQRSGVLTLTIQAATAANVTASVKYYTSSARWTPFYDMQVSKVGQPIDLTLKAQIAQTTGLDWQNVHITLSTGTPSRSNSVPELQPWRLYEVQPVQTSRMNYKAEKRAMRSEPMLMAEMAYDAAVEEEYEPQSMASYVEQTEQSLMTEYAIKLPYTIEGNGKEQTVTISEQKINDVEYRYQVVPKLDKTAYLTAEIKGWEQLNLLNGKANLIVGNTYFGQTTLNTASTQDNLQLTLGDDPQITVKRELLNEQSKRKTVGQNRQATQTYQIVVRNNKKEAVKLTLKEPYPVSSAKEITVEPGEQTTTPTEQNKNTGILTYDLDLQPGEARTITVSYTVKYPKDWNINL